MITVYCFGRVHPAVIGETRDLRALWTLEETGLPHRVQGLDHTGGELSAPEYSRLSYFNQVPTIDDDGFVLAESASILLYLAEKAGKLIPSDFQGRTRVVQWCFAALATVEPPLMQLMMKGMFGGNEEALRKWAGRVLGGVETRLDGREWIACDEFTVADVLLACVLRTARKTDLLDPHPRVKAYYERAFARASWNRTISAYAERLGANVSDIR